MTHLQESLLTLIEKYKYNELVCALLHTLIDNPLGTFDTNLRDKVLKQYNISRVSDLKNYTLDIVANYAELCLEDGVLTAEELTNITLLKIYLGINDGDFSKNGKMDVAHDILGKQLHLLYADGKIDAQEALLMTDMQCLFGLNYTEYEKIILEIAKQH